MAPAPTKTPSQAASSAAAARSQRRSVRATSSRRGPLPPVGTGARIAEGAGLGPGALTLAPGGRYRPLVVRFSMSEITTLGWSFERDVEAFCGRGRARDRSLAPQARGLRRAARRVPASRSGARRLLPRLVGRLPARRRGGRASGPWVERRLYANIRARTARIAIVQVSRLQGRHHVSQ